MTPAWPLSICVAEVTAEAHALDADTPCRIMSQIVFEMTSFIATSPTPVAVAAPALLSAYSPEPICGVSPILPGIFKATPPVDEAAAKFPYSSNETAPTVSVRRSGCACRSSEFLVG